MDLSQAAQIKGFVDSISTSTKSAAIMSMMLSSGSSLQYIWSMINNLSLSVHFVLLAVKNIPGNAAVFQEYLLGLDMASKVVPKWLIIDFDKYMKFTETEARNGKYETLEYESTNFILLSSGIIMNFLILIFQGFLQYLVHKIAVRFYKVKFWRHLAIFYLPYKSMFEKYRILFNVSYFSLAIFASLSIYQLSTSDIDYNASDIIS